MHSRAEPGWPKGWPNFPNKDTDINSESRSTAHRSSSILERLHQLARHLTDSMGEAMPNTYKAVEIKEWGTGDDPVSGIAVVERPVPTPGAGEVLVRLFLRPINPSDLFSLAGAVVLLRFIAVVRVDTPPS